MLYAFAVRKYSLIDGKQSQFLQSRLGDQESVEWVAVQVWQGKDSENVFSEYRQFPHARQPRVGADCFWIHLKIGTAKL